jgi:transcriptional regulator with XRE-family HTH domain
MQHRRRHKTFPNRLWKYRTRMGFTQRRVAEILGYHSSTDLSHYEHGRKVPSLVTALKLEVVYRVPVAFLFPDLYHELKGQLRAREERLLTRRRPGREKSAA